MINYLQKNLAVLFISFSSISAQAQWCVPATLIPYAASMPGITQVTLNNINRTSNDNEHHPGNNYTNTGLSTTLAVGSVYSISITHTIDASICPDMNLRVWIDYNQDGQLNDIGETAISIDHHLAGTYTGSFTVPLTALPGTTRMRVTAKMSNLGGHSLPDPCDIPADPLGYHGEMEDYTIQITSASAVEDHAPGLHSIRIYPTPAGSGTRVSFSLTKAGPVTIDLINLIGEKIILLSEPMDLPAGSHDFVLSLPPDLPNGYYLLRITSNTGIKMEKFSIVH